MASRGRTGAEIARPGRLCTILAAGALCSAWPARAQPRYETVVSAGDDSAPREDEAASASVITGDRTPRSAESLPELLAELPGVAVTRLGGLGALATLSIRGSAPSQVEVYLDGVPLNVATFGGVDLGSLPLGDLERIEVYRGMSPIAFGASGLGGVVALSTRIPDGSGVGAELGGGSFGTTLAGVRARWAGRTARLYLGLHHLAAAGDFPYPSDNGTAFDRSDDRILRRQNNGLQQTDGLVRLAIPLGGRELGASVALFARDEGLPGYAIFQSQQASLGTRRLLATVSYQGGQDLGPGGRLRLVLHGALGRQEFQDLRPDIAQVPTHTHDRHQSFGATLTAARPVGGWLRLRGILDARHEGFAPSDELATTPSGPPGTRTFGAAGVEALLARGNLEVIPSLRVEAAHDAILDRGLFGPAASDTRPSDRLEPLARLALVERPRPWLAVRANLGRYARLPSMFERYGNGGTFQGNPALRPESGINADLGAAVTLADTVTVDGALFAARVHDVIGIEQGRWVARARNIDEARVLGAELAGRVRRGHARMLAQATFTDARDVGGVAAYRGRQLPLRPRLRAYGRPELTDLPLPLGWRLGLYVEGDVTGGDYVDPANLARLPARVLLGAGLNVTSPAGRWRLVASGQNLGDSRINDLAGFPLPGRSAFLTLEWSTDRDSQPKENAP